MECFAIFAAAMAASSSKMRIFFILMAGSLILNVVLAAAVFRELQRWSRDMDKGAALWEREHREYVIASKMDEQRRWEDHDKFMKRLNARRR